MKTLVEFAADYISNQADRGHLTEQRDRAKGRYNTLWNDVQNGNATHLPGSKDHIIGDGPEPYTFELGLKFGDKHINFSSLPTYGHIKDPKLAAKTKQYVQSTITKKLSKHGVSPEEINKVLAGVHKDTTGE